MLKVVDGDMTYEFRGRLASIIRWLIRNAERINNGAGRIRFTFAGQDLKATIETDEALN